MTKNHADDDSAIIPPWAWANVLSLDSVAVGLVWLLVFTDEYCDRLPLWYEFAIIGLSIWLVYTADRLFDSIRLDTRRRHSIRHHFHHRYRKPLCLGWFLALSLDTALVVAFASEDQLRWGCAAIAIVVAYVASVQFPRNSARWLPKELQAGLVFAFGVSLNAWTAWTPQGTFSLPVSVGMAAILFTANCLTIAMLERDLDRIQAFDSWVLRAPGTVGVLPGALILHALIAAAWVAIDSIPPRIGFCLIASDAMLLVLAVVGSRSLTSGAVDGAGFVSTGQLVALADVALVIPPVVFWVARSVVESLSGNAVG
ncbi:hypothetical protein NZK35_00935 [Stieleria sp. ICT_E10.1]|uniref:hypothetical protein n=1 Tax=Stieleria sedimenti TaxID=2976331 RepID=UPI00218065E6|nr:hypothetical protein [Stieleria sedimenti]MCS7465233.1 hypothetical protein [Stieleria sedimenti]